MSDAFTVRDTVTVDIASVGAVLGIINTWKGYDNGLQPGQNAELGGLCHIKQG